MPPDRLEGLSNNNWIKMPDIVVGAVWKEVRSGHKCTIKYIWPNRKGVTVTETGIDRSIELAYFWDNYLPENYDAT